MGYAGYGYGFDPTYLVYLLPGLLLSMWAAFLVRSRFKRYSQVALSTGLTGAEVAARILRAAGIGNVRIEETPGFLSDHYDPGDKVLRLSPDVFQGNSVAAAGVAAHEVGHAIQDAEAYAWMGIRQKLVNPARIGSQAGVWLAAIGLAINSAGLAWVGVILFSAIVAFQLVTLPVEINASSRAKLRLQAAGIAVTAADAEGVEKVLNAAALTYLAAALTSIMQLLYFVMRILGQRDRD